MGNSGSEPGWIVLKFGGTSVSNLDRWQTIAEIARERRATGARVLIVCSATSGTSNDLEKLIEAAVRLGSDGHTPILERIRARHETLARELGGTLAGEPNRILDELERLATGASLLEESSPRMKARVMARGEYLSTLLGADYLQRQGLDVEWVDVRELLVCIDDENSSEARRFLQATCQTLPDPELRARLEARPAPIIITQGFVARDDAGRTVLLGRGGSDTSAAYLAAKLSAARCEIWTDVPGMYSANPHLIPSARLLKRLHYNEAEEIALTGAKVLHPRSIGPLWQQGIPLHLRCTTKPDAEGTVIDSTAGDGRAQVRAISMRTGITLISMESVGMWQQVGFLADAFAVFKRHSLSIDLVATSETNVTVSLDPAANAIDPGVIAALLHDLSAICEAKAIGPTAAVSLVGRGIRAILHQLGPALEVFAEERIHLMTQASSDLNLTFVVDESQAERLTRRLHALLISDRIGDDTLGATWQETFQTIGAADTQQSEQPRYWWRARRAELIEIARAGSPVYVYDRATLGEVAATITGLTAASRAFYALKANPHPEILKIFDHAGIGFECTSPGEIARVRESIPGIDSQRILFTPNFAARREYEDAFELGTWVTVDGLHPLRHWPKAFAGREILVRIDPGRGHGHHPHVKTAGQQSKFGISVDQLDELVELASAADARIIGLHAHLGSGILSWQRWSETAVFLAQVAEKFPETRILDLGGGFGVPEKPGQGTLDMESLGDSLDRIRHAHPRFELWLEPGRFLVAQSGVLLARVYQTKAKGDHNYIGLDAGMNNLIRPALYGAYHEIVNLSRVDEPIAMIADVVGPICESGDTFGYGRSLPFSTEDDIFLIATTGAYGRTMSSDYNLRGYAREVMLA